MQDAKIQKKRGLGGFWKKQPRAGMPRTAVAGLGGAARLRAAWQKEWACPDGPFELVTAGFALFLGLFSVGALVAIAYLNYTRLPWFDAWVHWLMYLERTDWWSFLFSFHNEHRIPVARLLYAADEMWFRADTRLLFWCTFLGQFGSAALVYRLSCADGSPRPALRITILGIILALLFAAPQWINFTMSFQISFVLVFFAAIAAFAALKNGIPGPGQTGARGCTGAVTLSIFMGLVASGTLANGLFVWPGLALMALFLRLPKRVVALIVVVGVSVIRAYLWHYPAVSGGKISDSLARAPELVAFTLAYLGSAVDEPLLAITTASGLNWEAYRLMISATVGALGLYWYLSMIAAVLRRRWRPTPARVAVLHVIGFLVVTAAVTSIGRIQYGVNDALTSRYMTPALLFWACLSALHLSVSDDPVNAVERAPRHRFRVAAVLLAAFVGGLTQPAKIAYAVDCERYLSEGEYAIINGVFDADAWKRFYQQPGAMFPVIQYFRQRKLASFSRDWPNWLGDPAASHFRITSGSSDCFGQWIYYKDLGNSFLPRMVVEGWAYDRRSTKAPELIVFVDDEHRIAGYSTPTRRRPDIVKQHPEFAADRIGWVCYLRVDKPRHLTAYGVLGDGRSLCPLSSAEVPGTYLAAPSANAGAILENLVAARADDLWSGRLPAQAVQPPFATETWSSATLSSGIGTLRLGPVKVSGGSNIGLPIMTGPGALHIRVSVVDRHSRATLAVAEVPVGRPAWELWRLDVPPFAPEMLVDYVIEDRGTKPNDWVAVGTPRRINP